jgi:hypothetical protein
MTIQEYRELHGSSYMHNLTSYLIAPVYNKPVINNFSEFDQETKKIYLQIYAVLSAYNPEGFELYATGSRINGSWRTKEESEALSQKYNIPISYSDYDFSVVAKNFPPFEEFINNVEGQVDIKGWEDRKVLVQP